MGWGSGSGWGGGRSAWRDTRNGPAEDDGDDAARDSEWLAGGQSGGNIPPDPGGRYYTPYGGEERFVPWSEDLPDPTIESNSLNG